MEGFLDWVLGEEEVKSGAMPGWNPAFRPPLTRGDASFVEGWGTSLRGAMRTTSMSGEEERWYGRGMG